MRYRIYAYYKAGGLAWMTERVGVSVFHVMSILTGENPSSFDRVATLRIEEV